MKCPCNCHDEQFRKDTNMKEHVDCGLCFIELFEEEQEFNTIQETEEFKEAVQKVFDKIDSMSDEKFKSKLLNSIGDYHFSHIKN